MTAHSNVRQFALFPEWLLNYRKDWLRPDVIAGLTAAAVVIPKAMAYATIAGLPVEVGLYTAFVPMVIYAILGSSRPLSVSTTTTLAILTAAELGEVAPGGSSATLLRAAMMLTLLVGGFLVLASLLRMGFIANFISEPVLVGFKAGIGVVIVLDQLPKILGVHFARGSFLQNLLATVRELPHTSLPTLAVGLVMLALLVGTEKFLPKAPAPLIAVAVGIAGSGLLGLQTHGVELVGRVPSGLPSFAIPDFKLAAQLWPGALGIALMSFTETIAAGRAFAKSGEPSPGEPPSATRKNIFSPSTSHRARHAVSRMMRSTLLKARAAWPPSRIQTGIRFSRFDSTLAPELPRADCPSATTKRRKRLP